MELEKCKKSNCQPELREHLGCCGSEVYYQCHCGQFTNTTKNAEEAARLWNLKKLGGKS